MTSINMVDVLTIIYVIVDDWYATTGHDMLTELGVIGKAKDGGCNREVLMKPGTDSYKKLMGKYRK